MKIELPVDVQLLLSELENSGFEGYVVGGCVRDSLPGIPPKDWDIATNATPYDMKEVFVQHSVVPTGEKYGTMTVVLNRVPYEVTAYRCDGIYGDGRRPDAVSFSKKIDEDLCRRDFTINALAYNETPGLVDLFGGQRDLRDRIIRCVGNPIDRFNEDALRIMRAIRFAVSLDFSISKETVHAIWECGANLKNVSQERKRDELVKILRGLHKLDKTSAHYSQLCRMVEYTIKRVIPEFQELANTAHNNPYHGQSVFDHSMTMLFSADTDDIELLLAVLFHDTGKVKARVFDEKRLTHHYYHHAKFSVELTKEIMGRMRFDNKTIENVLQLVKAHDYVIQVNKRCAKRLLNELGHDQCKQLLNLQYLDKMAHRWAKRNDFEEWYWETDKIRKLWDEILLNQEAFKISDLSINGDILIMLGYRQGIQIGEMLNRCLEYVIDNPDKNTLNDLRELVEREYVCRM